LALSIVQKELLLFSLDYLCRAHVDAQRERDSSKERRPFSSRRTVDVFSERTTVPLLARANAHLNHGTTRVRLLYRPVTSRSRTRSRLVCAASDGQSSPRSNSKRYTVPALSRFVAVPLGAFRHSVAPNAPEGRLVDLCLYVT